jgi:signal transduction histidine kinase
MIESYLSKLNKEGNLEKVFDALSFPIYIKNENNAFVFGNKAFLDLFNLSKDELFSISDKDSHFKNTDLFKDDTCCIALSTSKTDTITYFKNAKENIIFKTNKYFLYRSILGFDALISVSVKPLKAENDIDNVLDVFVQVTRKAEETEILKKEIVANISHEMKTPISHIIGFSELLIQDGELDADKKAEYLFHIYSAAHKLNSVVDDMLEVSQIKSGNVPIYKELFGIKDLVSEIFNYFKNELNFKEIEHSMTFNGINAVFSDGHRVKQVLINLVDNAIKFTNKGRISFELKIEDNSYVFALSDTGCGIDEKYHDKIFEDFFMIDKGLLKKYQGTGLGLYVAKAIVESLGGEIKVESKKGEGASFYFKLPYIEE